MKVNSLLSDLIRGEWLMDVHSIGAFAPIVHKIISGEEVVFQNSASALMGIQDKNGNRIRPDESGAYDIPPGSVATVNMMGAVIKYGDFCTYGADEIVSALRFANSQKNIKGIVFAVDGPGGAVSAIGPFLQFAREKTKPVVALADAAMSLHYWAAVSIADAIIADNDVSARFGSVGVISSFVDSRGMLEEKGYKFHDIVPEESIDKNKAFFLALEEKYDMIKEEHLSPIARKFQAAVRAGRPQLKEAAGVLTGKTFSAEQSIEYGMIDGIGSFADALTRIDILNELKSFK